MGGENLKERAQAFQSKKRLGQHFLINQETLVRIAHSQDISPLDHILEIGPGLGFLTSVLLETGASITAVELDIDCVKVLNDLTCPQLKVIHQDFLQCNLAEILEEKTKVIGNIPYQITTPILCRLLGEIGEPTPWLKSIQSIVLTVQQELAKRLVARAGEDDYSQISVLVQYFTEAKLLFTVAPEDFYPIPEVTSAVVRLVPHVSPPVQCNDHKLLRQVVKAGFKQRRKMLKNNLSFLAYDQEIIMAVFDKLNFDPQVRAERLDLQQFALLANELSKTKQSSKNNMSLSV